MNEIELNNKYIADKVEELELYLAEDREFEFVKVYLILKDCFSIYSNNKETFEKLINILSIFLKKIGFSYFLDGLNEPSFYDHNCNLIEEILLNTIDSKPFRKTSVNGKATILQEFPEAKYDGLIAFMGYNKFFDVLEKLIIEILVPYINDHVFSSTKITMLEIGYCNYVKVKNLLNVFNSELSNLLDSLIDGKIRKYTNFEGREKIKDFTLPICYGNEKEIRRGFLFNLGNNLFVTNFSLFKDIDKQNSFGFLAGIDNNTLPLNDKYKFSIKIVKFDSKNDLVIVEINSDVLEDNLESIDCELIGDFSKEKYVYLQGANNCSNSSLMSWFSTSDSFGFIVEEKGNLIITDAPFPPSIYGGFAYTKEGNFVGLVKTKKTFKEKTSVVPSRFILDFVGKN